ncbi:MAG: cysteine synthase A [Marinicella sp.]|nr:cysteine synthase A [Xanthomonadales bacterium]
MVQIHQNILSTVGNTPIVRINNIGPKNVNLYVKVESFNPLGSVKDRLALGIIEAAEKSGELKPGQTVVEATSGNTGIGLAMVCAQKGYPLVIVMAENFSEERRKLLRFLGAKLILTHPYHKGSGMTKKAKELADKHGWFLARQFENEANTEIHEKTTAVEIADAFANIGLDYWVSGYGTGGTLSGVARGLKKLSPATKIVAAEPDNIQILASGIPQPETEYSSHPGARPHPIQGWTPDFIPKIISDDILRLVDYFQPVNGNDAFTYSKLLARKEGIFVGISSGATFAAALEVAKHAPENSNILCMLPDTGERYLSSPLFDDIEVTMNDEEKALAKSTETARYDVPFKAPHIDFPNLTEMNQRVVTEVHSMISDNKVMMFSLEWCDFCISIKQFFEARGIKYQYIDVDAASLKQGHRGDAIKKVVMSLTESISLPQLYIGGQLIGGFSNFCQAYNSKQLEQLLVDFGVTFNNEDISPNDFTPAWVGKAS